MNEPVIVLCPKCGAEHKDYDGFGVLYCEACHWCSHPDRYGGVCQICGHHDGTPCPSDWDSASPARASATNPEPKETP